MFLLLTHCTEALLTIAQEEATSEAQSQSSCNNETSQPKPCIMQVLQAINNNKVNTIYSNKQLYYFFLSKCVREVVGKMQWKENICCNNYSQFVHPTDESFALLVLDNNMERYFDMIARKEKQTDKEPKYTTATKKGKKTFIKGWSDEGKLKFQEYTKFVMQQRNNSAWLKDKVKFVIKTANKEFGKRKRKENESDNKKIKRMNLQQQKDWNNFLCDSMNDKEWIKNSVGV